MEWGVKLGLGVDGDVKVGLGVVWNVEGCLGCDVGLDPRVRDDVVDGEGEVDVNWG